MEREKLVKIILIVAFVITAGAATFFYTELARLRKNPQEIAQAETRALVEKVSKLIILPEDETPTVATITDPEKLKDQKFFAGSRKGDKVLIYTNARKAILYSPEENKLVDVAPLNIGAGAGAAAAPTP